MVAGHIYSGRLVMWHRLESCIEGSCVMYPAPEGLASLRTALHALIDVPLPIGMIHAYLTSLELSMNGLVGRLSREFFQAQESEGSAVEPPIREPFELFCSNPWSTLAGWCALGVGIGFLVFVAMLVKYGLMIMFFIVLCMGVFFNFKFSDDSILLTDDHDLFA
ncbi:hypothetical protein FRC09_003936 [Ceratobasidium sp. 395]|nr:hypothetical protein FRC09_003936 [Ceratobasidium sp. 395]